MNTQKTHKQHSEKGGITLSYSDLTDEEFENFKRKKDILLYKNNLNNIRNFKSEKAYKELLLAIIDFANGKNENPTFTNEQAEATFEIIKSGLIENAKNYSLKCATNRENAKKGIEKKRNVKELVSELANNMSTTNKDNMLDEHLKKSGKNSYMLNQE